MVSLLDLGNRIKGFFSNLGNQGVSAIQQGIQNYAQQNPTQAGNIIQKYEQPFNIANNLVGRPALETAKAIGNFAPQFAQSAIRIAPPVQLYQQIQGAQNPSLQPQIQKQRLADSYNMLKGLGLATTPVLTQAVAGGVGVGINAINNAIQKKPLLQNYDKAFGQSVVDMAPFGPIAKIAGAGISALGKVPIQPLQRAVSAVQSLERPIVRIGGMNPISINTQLWTRAIGAGIKGIAEGTVNGSMRPLAQGETRQEAIIKDSLLFGAMSTVLQGGGDITQEKIKPIAENVGIAFKDYWKFVKDNLTGHGWVETTDGKLVRQGKYPGMINYPSTIKIGKSTQDIPANINITEGPLDRKLSQPVGPTTTETKFPQQLPEVPKMSGDGSQTPSLEGSIPSNDPVQKIIQALKEAKPLEQKQGQIYAKIRSQQAGAVAGVGANVPGEKGYFAQLAQLKGEMPKVSFESIRSQLDQPTIDALFNKVEQSHLTPFEKVTAKSGLAKLLGGEGGSVPVKSELNLLNEIFPPEFIQAIQAKRPIMQRFFSNVVDALNIPRAIMATADMSAPLRQGAFLIGKPKEWIPAFGSMVKYFFNPKSYEGLAQDIQARPTYQLMRESKLAITNMGQNLSTHEETFMSNLVGKIPGIGIVTKASERAYSGFLNKLRADVFDSLLQGAKDQGVDVKTVAPDIAKFVNSATGRGDLGFLTRSAPVLTNVLFSPRLLASRLNLLNPVYYAQLNPYVRKEAIKSLFTFAGTAMTALTLAKLGGAEVGADPRSADFGKIKLGNTRYDILAGFQQPIRLASQLLTGKIISTTTGKEITLGEGYKPMTRAQIAGNFLASKENPVVSMAMGLLQGVDNIGQPFNVAPQLVQRFIPLIIQDMYDIAKDRNSPLAALMGIPGIFGVGVQTYGKQIPSMNVSPTGKASVKFSPLPGLPEDIVSKVTGQPAIPNQINDPTLFPAYQQKQQEKILMDKIKQQAEKGTMTPQGNYVPVNIDGTIKVIDTSFQPTPPKLTGLTELDKKAVTKFNGDITQKANDIYDLYKAGQLTQDQANTQLSQLQSLKAQFAKPKKPKKITIKVAKLKKIKISGFNTKSVKIKAMKLPKMPKIKIAKSKTVRLTF